MRHYTARFLLGAVMLSLGIGLVFTGAVEYQSYASCGSTVPHIACAMGDFAGEIGLGALLGLAGAGLMVLSNSGYADERRRAVGLGR